MIGIYRVRNLVNGKSYIGQSIDIQRRFWDHRCLSHERNIYLRRSLKKYGKENFAYEILEECKAEDLDEREKYYIEKLKPEYNVMRGGQGIGRHVSNETKELLRKHGKAQWERKSEEDKQRIIQNNLLCGGKPGHPVLEETRQKLRERNLGRPQSVETREKRKQTIREKKMAGYIQTNAGHKKKVRCIETGVVYESVKAAGIAFGIKPTRISSVLHGRQKSTANFHFEYLKV